ncbi:Mce-associated membrane protein [Mycobacterium sp. BK086]|nr:Mce-associated membrane protein [Mycobacterium sp. BK086]
MSTDESNKESSDMTKAIVGEDEKADATEAEATVEATPEATSPEPHRGSRSRSFWVAVVLVVVLIGGGTFGFVKYREVSGQLAQLRQAQADRDAAAQLARDYAMKSLTYTFEDPDAFFHAVEDGVSQQLKDKYVNATDLLKAVMLQAQVTSSGEVLAVDPALQPDGSYEVVVSAHQTTRNLQNPTPKVSIILLRVTVNKAGDGWQVTDIGPKTGTKAPEEQQIPGAAPPGPAPAPGAGPAPAPAPAPPAPAKPR